MAPAIPPAHARIVCDADDDISYHMPVDSFAICQQNLALLLVAWIGWSVPMSELVSNHLRCSGKILQHYLLSQPPVSFDCTCGVGKMLIQSVQMLVIECLSSLL